MKFKEFFSRSNIKIPLVLVLITAFSALLIGVVYSITSDIIRENRLRAELAAVETIFYNYVDEIYDIELVDEDDINNPGIITAVRIITRSDGSEIGRAITGDVTNSYGRITLMIGINQGNTEPEIVGFNEIQLSQSASHINRVRGFLNTHITPGLNESQVPNGVDDVSAGATAGVNSILTIVRTAFLEFAGEEPTTPELREWVIETNLFRAITMMFPNVNEDYTRAAAGNWYAGGTPVRAFTPENNTADINRSTGFMAADAPTTPLIDPRNGSPTPYFNRTPINNNDLFITQADNLNAVLEAGFLDVRNSDDENIGFVVILDGHARGHANAAPAPLLPSGDANPNWSPQHLGAGNGAHWSFRFALGFTNAATANMVDFIPLHSYQTYGYNGMGQGAPSEGGLPGNHYERMVTYILTLRNNVTVRQHLIRDLDIIAGSTQGSTTITNMLMEAFRLSVERRLSPTSFTNLSSNNFNTITTNYQIIIRKE